MELQACHHAAWLENLWHRSGWQFTDRVLRTSQIGFCEFRRVVHKNSVTTLIHRLGLCSPYDADTPTLQPILEELCNTQARVVHYTTLVFRRVVHKNSHDATDVHYTTKNCVFGNACSVELGCNAGCTQFFKFRGTSCLDWME